MKKTFSQGAKSWGEFEEAMAHFITRLKDTSPELQVEQKAARVALTKSSFRIGQVVFCFSLLFFPFFSFQKAARVALTQSSSV
jgi:hypothetical protein